jgi:phosphoribosylformylglycinamidine synthase PurS subunit
VPGVAAVSGGRPNTRIVVDVMLKPEIADPQGQAVADALPRLGFHGIRSVRQGKRFELEVDGPVDDAMLDTIRKAAETLLANPVIEDFHVRIEEI